ncbi:hypothetical protein KIN20_024334 [Parelaphostrongylus tenuis]|uniref:Uncharacterized protein n=1 Tax=Parelaphostrongylus tenuis TaxID=148309 RepID=A0AAD5MT97_PARTN|nr:hypothetical protein KIN20_024334 [Parelaphostrongylus tenuis]
MNDNSRIIVGGTVTGICPPKQQAEMCLKVGMPIDGVPFRNSHGLNGYLICTTSFYKEKILCRLRASSWLIGRGRCGKTWTECFEC